MKGMKSMSAVLAISLAGALTAGVAMAQTNQGKPADKASQKFIANAIEGDIAEIDIGRLAQEKGQSAAVKEFGAMLVKDHGAHKAKAEEVASQLGVKPPTRSSFGAKATYAKLKILSGASFDRNFAKAMVKDHQEDIKEFEKESSKNDPAGQLAKESLPTLQKHLQQTQQLTAQKQSSR